MIPTHSTGVPKPINSVPKSRSLTPAGDPDSQLWSPALAPDSRRMRTQRAATPRSRLTSASSGRKLSWIHVRTVAASIVLLVVALLGASLVPNQRAGTLVGSSGGAVQALAASGLNFDYVVIILMENHNICEIYTHCGGTGTYMTALADAYSIALQDDYCNVNPSLPNYLCLSGATDFGCSGYDGGPNSNACTNSAWNSPNIVDRILGAGLTWKAYMEDMPSNCYGSDSGNYAVRHDPFVYYNDIVSNATRCTRVVPAGSSD